MSVWSLL
ncbi:hypothetical protein HU200_066659 [Digitaria exilis]|nr:hypothetical protein HU200_066659 [Digitaria exilis]